MYVRTISFVISAILGSGIFILPILMKGLGASSIVGFSIVSLLSLLIGISFTQIKGGIFEFLEKQFGRKAAFVFVWSYWIISWASTVIVINEIAIYMKGMFPALTKFQPLIQSGFVLFFILLNMFGVGKSGYVEVVLTFLKIVPLIVIPIYAFFFSKINLPSSNAIVLKQVLSSIPLSMWSFVGIECGCIIGNQINKSQTEEKSKVFYSTLIGILITIVIYIANLLAIFKKVGINSSFPNPYSSMSYIFFGDIGRLLFVLTVIVVCLGTLNSWIASSTLTGSSASEIGLFPRIFNIRNSFNAPYVSVLLSSLPLVIFGLCINLESISKIMIKVTDASSKMFFVFYLAILVALFKENKKWYYVPLILALIGAIGSGDYVTLIFPFALLILSFIFYFLIAPNKPAEEPEEIILIKNDANETNEQEEKSQQNETNQEPRAENREEQIIKKTRKPKNHEQEEKSSNKEETESKK